MKIYKLLPDLQLKYPPLTIKYANLSINNGLKQRDFEEIMEKIPETDLRQQLMEAKYCFAHLFERVKKESPDVIHEDNFLVLNSRALSILKDHFGDIFEFFQLKPELRHYPHKKFKGLIEFPHKSEDWFIAYQTQALSVLDYDKSMFPRIGRGIAWIYGHFNQMKIGNRQIFRLFWEPTLANPNDYEKYFYQYTRFFVTDTFVDVLKNSDLKYDLKFVLYFDSDDQSTTDHLPDQGLDRALLEHYRAIRNTSNNTTDQPISPKPNVINVSQLETRLESDPQMIIQNITHYLDTQNVPRDQATALGLLWAEQLHRQYNWVWLEKDGTWFITHPNHEDMNPIELITDVLEKRMTAFQLSALFNTLGLTS
jgi:hypothetical protein